MTQPAAVISGDCQHEDWTARAQVIRDTDVEGGPIIAWSFELTATCAGCGAPMLWYGHRAGDDAQWEDRKPLPGPNLPIAPFISPDRVTIMLPCEPHPPGARS